MKNVPNHQPEYYFPSISKKDSVPAGCGLRDAPRDALPYFPPSNPRVVKPAWCRAPAAGIRCDAIGGSQRLTPVVMLDIGD